MFSRAVSNLLIVNFPDGSTRRYFLPNPWMAELASRELSRCESEDEALDVLRRYRANYLRAKRRRM